MNFTTLIMLIFTAILAIGLVSKGLSLTLLCQLINWLFYHYEQKVGDALEAKATGCPSCRSAAPSPFFDASTWTVTGFCTLKYQSVVSFAD